ncbi:hypothetical protein GOP47_0008021 [Adiantum capillus-veneris]|uniref:Myb/SANT-like DNA-binding domain-containing protein n=1 Tax=Adiantum capillus-veneris TaxID=13818 RepID=A0A9D4V2Q0_ADICA|nr:hypothetical protein GOP47_0007775 [Adiantum capillus-veneris]KAI5078197.1 hypothetical protein GOP47_0008021 [Adiantum capillus-veneris]
MASDDAEPQPQPAELSAKKPPGTWTPIETIHLIDAYQEKWYALKRGQLRTRHWDEVAESLAARCAGHPDASDKSSVQCRHKLEKLRRRYRAERQICLREGPGASQWPFFDRMDLMERGPGAAVVGVRAALPFPDLDYQKRCAVSSSKDFPDHESPDDDDAEDSDQPPPKVYPGRKRSHHHHHHHQSRASFDDNDGSYTSLNRKHGGLYETPKSFSMKDEYRNLRSSEKPSSSHGKSTDSAPFSELVSLIGSLGEAFLRMEQMRVQMQRETERFRADMELRRTEMVLDCQKQIAELFTKALFSNKRSKKNQSSED